MGKAVSGTDVQRRLAAILSADVVGYSRLMAEDEEATVQAIKACRDLVSARIESFRGRVVGAPGDNILAEFPSAVDAARAAVEIQRALEVYNESHLENRRMRFRIGVNLGDIIVDGPDIYGDGINIAARLESLAVPGGICLSGTVFEQVHAKLGLPCEDLGEQMVKNIPDPVRVYSVRMEGGTSAAPSRAGLSWPATAAVLVMLLAMAVLLWSRPEGPSELEMQTAALLPVRSLAVLPLDNLSDDLEQEYFADGMTEALIADLAKLDSLRVISRTSVMLYKDARKPLPVIAAELSVDAVVEGSVLRVGNRVRITAQLIDARRDHHLWSESYEGDVRDVLGLQRKVARAITDAIEIVVTPAEEARLAPAYRVIPAAYEAYLKGRYYLQKTTKADHVTAGEYMQQAIELDPTYAPAWAGLADVFT